MDTGRKDAKGRTIWQGPRGGMFVYSMFGRKVPPTVRGSTGLTGLFRRLFGSPTARAATTKRVPATTKRPRAARVGPAPTKRAAQPRQAVAAQKPPAQKPPAYNPPAYKPTKPTYKAVRRERSKPLPKSVRTSAKPTPSLAKVFSDFPTLLQPKLTESARQFAKKRGWEKEFVDGPTLNLWGVAKWKGTELAIAFSYAINEEYRLGALIAQYETPRGGEAFLTIELGRNTYSTEGDFPHDAFALIVNALAAARRRRKS